MVKWRIAIRIEKQPKLKLYSACGKLENNGADQLIYYRTLHYFNTCGRVSSLEVADEVGISLQQIQYYENPSSSRLGDAKFSVVERLAEAVINL